VIRKLPLAQVLKNFTRGCSYVDYCNWVLPFKDVNHLRKNAAGLLTQVKATLEYGLTLDQDKFERAWITKQKDQ
jgi:hypothetical protein